MSDPFDVKIKVLKKYPPKYYKKTRRSQKLGEKLEPTAKKAVIEDIVIDDSLPTGINGRFDEH